MQWKHKLRKHIEKNKMEWEKDILGKNIYYRLPE